MQASKRIVSQTARLIVVGVHSFPINEQILELINILHLVKILFLKLDQFNLSQLLTLYQNEHNITGSISQNAKKCYNSFWAVSPNTNTVHFAYFTNKIRVVPTTINLNNDI